MGYGKRSCSELRRTALNRQDGEANEAFAVSWMLPAFLGGAYIVTVTDFISTGVIGQSSFVFTLEILTIIS